MCLLPLRVDLVLGSNLCGDSSAVGTLSTTQHQILSQLYYNPSTECGTVIMGFNSESALKETAAPVLKRKLARDDAEVVEEFSYSAGRTDLVFTYKSDAYLRRRVKELGVGIPITDISRLKAFLRLHNRGAITDEYFCQLGANSRRESEIALEWLNNNGFAERTENGKVRTVPYLRRHITTAIAVELKLEKWRDAFRQALRGRSFSEYQYVVLDAAHVSPALDNVGMFERRGIGLASIDTDGTFVNHHSPDKRRPFSELYTWKLNEKTLRRSDVVEV